jgi:septum formation protein
MTRTLILASASARRKELLAQIGLDCIVQPADIDETVLSSESPADYVRRLAIAKAESVQKAMPEEQAVFIGSDTTVVIQQTILGKPEGKVEGLTMLRMLSGKTHRVLSAVAVLGNKSNCMVSESLVTFKPLTDEDIEWYWATGEPIGKAGAYAIQGKAAAFVERLEGSYSGVMGLPLYETVKLLEAENVQIS